MAETPEEKAQADKPPEAIRQGPSPRVTATVVSLAALAVIGAATANFLPNSDRFALPSFDSVSLPKLDGFSLPSLPKFDHFALPNFNRAPPPKSDRVAAPKPPPPLVPDPVVRAALRDVQSSQQQHTSALETLTQSSETQQADLKRISRQISSLTAQVNALHGAVSPQTTGSIPHSNPRARIIRTARRTLPPAPPAMPALPKPVGPVSVGGAPLSSTPGSGA